MLYIKLLGLIFTSVLLVFKTNYVVRHMRNQNVENLLAQFKSVAGWLAGLLFFVLSFLLVIIYSLPGFYIQLADLIITLAIISVIDIKSQVVPNCIIVSLVITQSFAAFAYAQTYISLWNVAISVVILLVLVFVSKISKEQIGMGDVKLITAVNLFYGLSFTMYSMLFGMFVVLIFSIPLMIAKKIDLKSQLPFIPFYTIGVVVYTILNII